MRETLLLVCPAQKVNSSSRCLFLSKWKRRKLVVCISLRIRYIWVGQLIDIEELESAEPIGNEIKTGSMALIRVKGVIRLSRSCAYCQVGLFSREVDTTFWMFYIFLPKKTFYVSFSTGRRRQGANMIWRRAASFFSKLFGWCLVGRREGDGFVGADIGHGLRAWSEENLQARPQTSTSRHLSPSCHTQTIRSQVLSSPLA